MSEIQYNLQFAKLCEAIHLGDLVCTPKEIMGGLLNRMYSLETTKGKYAIKALNPEIMLRPEAMSNYINSERIANLVSNNIPALPAKRFKDAFMHEIDNQYYLVFDWIDGKSLKSSEININHCEKIGAILANIHTTDFSELEIIDETSGNPQPIDWREYLRKGQGTNSVWVNQFLEIIDKLYAWNMEANRASELLASDMVISHRDLDPKNVMWSQNNPIIIDWEAAGYINPMQELIETAIYWSETETGNIDKEKFSTFIGGYKKRYGSLKADWEIVLASGFSGKLNWLEYNLKRSLLIECTDEKEQQMGANQVIETIKALERYENTISEVEKWLNNI